MCCRACCRRCSGAIRDLRVELRETQTRCCSTSSRAARSTCVMLALPVDGRRARDAARCSTIRSCWRCRPTDAAAAERARRRRATSISERLILLEEGHCLRDQALAFCASAGAATSMGLGATSPRDRDADGGERLRRHAGAAGRRRRRGARRAREAAALRVAAAGPHHRARLAAHLAAQGGFRRARPDRRTRGDSASRRRQRPSDAQIVPTSRLSAALFSRQ